MNVKPIDEKEFNTCNGAVIEVCRPNPNRPYRFTMKKGSEVICIAFKSNAAEPYEYYKAI